MTGERAALFLAGMWLAWYARNAQCLGGEDVPCHKIMREAKFLSEAISIGFKVHSPPARQPKLVTWNASAASVQILNVDGSFVGKLGPARLGGLLRTSEGKWLFGFYGAIGFSDNLQAQLASILFCLSIAWDFGSRSLVCYCDSSLAVELCSKHVSSNHAYASLFLASRRSLLELGKWICGIR